MKGRGQRPRASELIERLGDELRAPPCERLLGLPRDSGVKVLSFTAAVYRGQLSRDQVMR
jgi:hypothetical protein